MKLLIFLPMVLLLEAAAPPPTPTPTPTPSVFTLPEIVHAQLWGNEVLLLHADLSVTLVNLFDLGVEEPVMMNASGYPTVFLISDVPGNPSVIETSYASTVGVHVVRTACKGMSEVRCAEKHKKQVTAMQAIFRRI